MQNKALGGMMNNLFSQSFFKLFFKQYPYCNFIGTILQYTSIIKGERYLVLQTINRLFCPKEVVIVVHHHSIRGLSKCV